jgi:hypothetical protein
MPYIIVVNNQQEKETIIMKVKKVFEHGDGISSYEQIKNCGEDPEILKVLDGMKLNERISLGASGYIRRIQ